MFKAILSTVTGALGGVWGYVATAAGAAAIAGYLAFSITNAYNQNVIKDLKLADANAQVDAVQTALLEQKVLDGIRLDAAVAEAEAQQHIVVQHETITREIPIYVKDTSTCITFGLVRLLHSAALGLDPASDNYTSGQPDDACAPLSWTALAADYSDDLATGRSNAEQLTALQAYISEISATPATK